MKTLVLITSGFPFGAGEAFIDAELPVLYKGFGKTIVITQNVILDQTRTLPDDVEIIRYNPATSFRGFIYSPVLLLKNVSLISEICRGELNFRNEIDFKISFRQKMFLFRKIVKAIQLRDFIRHELINRGITSDIVFYSYWLNSGAHAIGLTDFKNSIRIARAHGSDLYEELTVFSYLPLLKFVSDRLDSVFFISEHGKKYFLEKTHSKNTHLEVSRLGVKTPDFEVNNISVREPFTIVSCSNLIPLKRINLIIESLNLLKTAKKIKWVHFGAGFLKNELERLASDLLGKKENISYEFMGQLSNNDILKFYSGNYVNLFLNTSKTEGIPVSIMEAQSFGIPVIATNVGGVSEIVTEGTGFLLSPDFTPEELMQKITLFLNMEPEEERKLREKAFSNWNQYFKASVNYSDFLIRVNRIFESSIKQNR